MEHKASTATLDAQPAAGRGDQGTAAGDQAAEAVTRQRFELLRSALYHDRGAHELQRLNRLLTFANVLLSSAAIAAFGASVPAVGQGGGVAVAAISAVQLVWDFSGRAARHEDLRRRFYDLLADLEAGAGGDAVNARMVRIFADEPAIVHRWNRRAHNQAGDSVYGPGRFERA